MSEEIIIDKEDFWTKLMKNPEDTVEKLFTKIEKLVGIIQRLKQENEELKEKINKFEWDNPYYILYANVVTQRDKYKQALEEIRDFINPTYFDCKNCKELKKPFTQQNCNGFKYEAILNKINEVLEDNEDDN